MLFNLDRNLKQSILAEYKKEALLYEQKKQLEKQQKIKEEQEYLEQLNKQEEENYKKLKDEENLKKTNQMKYYQEILNSPDKNSRKKELIIKNWGQPRKGLTPYKENKNIFRKDTNNSNSNKYEIDYNSLSPIQKQKIYIRKSDDHMNNYLTDEQNKDELSKFLKEEKIYRQKYYKDLVNSQYEEAQRINKDRYGTNDILIIEKKRKNYFNENNISKKNYDFGKSTLMHNPIVNPENNITYNKYINFRLNKSNIFKTENSLKNLKEINNNSATLSIQTDDYLPNKRIIKIKDNNNYNIINNSAKDIKSILFPQNEPNSLNNEESNNNDISYRNNNYGRFSNDNIFDYRNKRNINNNNNPNRNAYDMNNSYDHKSNDQSASNGSILSQAAKSNFLI